MQVRSTDWGNTTYAAVAAALVLLVGWLIVQSDPRPETRLRLRDGSAWLTSTTVGQISLHDGGDAAVVTALPIAEPGERFRAEAAGTDVLIVNETSGAIARVQGSTWSSDRPPVAVAPPSETIDVLVGETGAWFVRRGSVAVLDVETLTRLSEYPLGDSYEAGAVAADGSLFVASADANAPMRRVHTDGTVEVIDAVTGPAQFVDLDDGVVAVDLDERSVWVEGRGVVCDRLDVLVDDEIHVGGYGDDVVMVTSTGGVFMWQPKNSGCPSARAGFQSIDAGAFGRPEITEGWGVVPVLDRGEAVIVDVERARVVSQVRLDSIAAGTTFELLGETGAVWFNDPASAAAGLIRRDGTVIYSPKYQDSSLVGDLALGEDGDLGLRDDPGESGSTTTTTSPEATTTTTSPEAADPTTTTSAPVERTTTTRAPPSDGIRPEPTIARTTSTTSPEGSDETDDPNESTTTEPALTLPPPSITANTSIPPLGGTITAPETTVVPDDGDASTTVPDSATTEDSTGSTTDGTGDPGSTDTTDGSEPGDGTDPSTVTIGGPSTTTPGDGESTTTTPANSAPIVRIGASSNQPTVGSTVTFETLITAGSPTVFSWAFTPDPGGAFSNGSQQLQRSFEGVGPVVVSVEACDDAGRCGTATAQISVVPAGVPEPLNVNFSVVGEARVGSAIELRGAATGDPDSWSWTFENATPGNSTEMNPVVTFNRSGPQVVEVTVRRGDESNTFSRTVDVAARSNAPQPFVLRCSPRTAEERATVQCSIDDFSMTNFDDLNWSVDADDGGAVSTSQAGEGRLDVTYDAPGVVTVTARALDIGSEQTVRDRAVIVYSPKPVAAPIPDVTGPARLEVGETGTYRASNSGGDVAEYIWSATGGAPAVRGDRYDVSWDVPGTYFITLAAVGPGGAATVSQQVIVEDADPVATGPIIISNLLLSSEGTSVTVSFRTDVCSTASWAIPALDLRQKSPGRGSGDPTRCSTQHGGTFDNLPAGLTINVSATAFTEDNSRAIGFANGFVVVGDGAIDPTDPDAQGTPVRFTTSPFVSSPTLSTFAVGMATNVCSSLLVENLTNGDSRAFAGWPDVTPGLCQRTHNAVIGLARWGFTPLEPGQSYTIRLTVRGADGSTAVAEVTGTTTSNTTTTEEPVTTTTEPVTTTEEPTSTTEEVSTTEDTPSTTEDTTTEPTTNTSADDTSSSSSPPTSESTTSSDTTTATNEDEEEAAESPDPDAGSGESGPPSGG